MNNIKCKKCGAVNSATSKFCSSCGEPLNQELKCPKCFEKIKSTDKFCGSCGYNLIPSKQQSTISKNKKPKIETSFILRVVSYGIACLSILLLLIGFLGSSFSKVATANYLGETARETENSRLSHYFSDLFNIISSSDASVTGLQRFLSFVELAAFLVCICGVILITVKFVISLVRTTKTKEFNIDSKNLFTFMCAFIIPHLIIVMLANHNYLENADDAFSIKYFVNYGWGSVLLFISLTLMFVSSIVKECINHQKNLISYVASKVGIFLLIFVIAFGFRSCCCAAIGNEKVGASIFIHLISRLSSHSNASLAPLIVCLIFTFINIVTIILTIKYLNENKKVAIVFSAISIVLFIVCENCAGAGVNLLMREQYGKEYAQSSGYGIAAIVLSAFVLASSIVARVTDKNK